LDITEIKQVIDLMKRNSLTEFEIEAEGLKLRICRNQSEQKTVVMHGTPPPFPTALDTSAIVPPLASKTPEEEKGVAIIKSPMVGTFYSASSPESAPFAAVGADVIENSVVCIIEAMKVMNEIQADVTGKITGILVNNGDSVEFGQPLFKVKQD